MKIVATAVLVGLCVLLTGCDDSMDRAIVDLETAIEALERGNDSLSGIYNAQASMSARIDAVWDCLVALRDEDQERIDSECGQRIDSILSDSTMIDANGYTATIASDALTDFFETVDERIARELRESASALNSAEEQWRSALKDARDAGVTVMWDRECEDSEAIWRECPRIVQSIFRQSSETIYEREETEE